MFASQFAPQERFTQSDPTSKSNQPSMTIRIIAWNISLVVIIISYFIACTQLIFAVQRLQASFPFENAKASYNFQTNMPPLLRVS